MRVSYFNELDSLAMHHKLNTEKMINGISLDPRIGDHHNNPSFGYGGYCLPKDTKQLKSDFAGIPQNLISSIIDSNITRKKYIANFIIEKYQKKTLGIYKLSMKKNSNNYRDSAILDIIEIVAKFNQNIIIFDPCIESDSFMGFEVEHSLDRFKKRSEIILANRHDDEILDLGKKVFSRDVFNES